MTERGLPVILVKDMHGESKDILYDSMETGEVTVRLYTGLGRTNIDVMIISS